jgi:hypothetical protein
MLNSMKFKNRVLAAGQVSITVDLRDSLGPFADVHAAVGWASDQTAVVLPLGGNGCAVSKGSNTFSIKVGPFSIPMTVDTGTFAFLNAYSDNDVTPTSGGAQGHQPGTWCGFSKGMELYAAADVCNGFWSTADASISVDTYPKHLDDEAPPPAPGQLAPGPQQYRTWVPGNPANSAFDFEKYYPPPQN